MLVLSIIPLKGLNIIEYTNMTTPTFKTMYTKANVYWVNDPYDQMILIVGQGTRDYSLHMSFQILIDSPLMHVGNRLYETKDGVVKATTNERLLRSFTRARTEAYCRNSKSQE